MSEPKRKRVQTLDSLFASTRGPPQADALQNDTEDSSTSGEQTKGKEVADESSERKTTNVRSFQTRWLLDHTWLRFENGAMFCHFCHRSKTNPFGSAGCTNFRTSTLQRHKDCKDHEDALHEEVMRDTFNNQQRCVMREQSHAIITAMKAVYWLAKEDIATVKYNSMLTFLEEVGVTCVKDLHVAGNATY